MSDIEELFGPVVDSFAYALENLKYQLCEAFGGIKEFFRLMEKADPIRYAIEVLDIPENDIRYIDYETWEVVTWNRRRIPLDPGNISA